jgi:hypothetical protein
LARRLFSIHEASGDIAAPDGSMNSVLESNDSPRPFSMVQLPSLPGKLGIALPGFSTGPWHDHHLSFRCTLDAEVRVELAKIVEFIIRHRRRMKDHRRLRFHVIEQKLHD